MVTSWFGGRPNDEPTALPGVYSIMHNMLRSAPVLAALVVLTACGRQSDMDEAMKADLDAASTATIEMAPRGAGTHVVSAIEARNPTQPQVTPVRRVAAPARTPKPETPQVTQAASAPEPTATRPSTTPAVSPPPPGGYKSVGEVIRNAPFPIKP
jgi:predicted small lipoprotein YifL